MAVLNGHSFPRRRGVQIVDLQGFGIGLACFCRRLRQEFLELFKLVLVKILGESRDASEHYGNH